MTYVYYSCECGFEAKVVGTWEEVRDISMGEFSCPCCMRALLGSPVRRADPASTYDLTVEEFFRAVNGMGLPDETVTHIEPVVAMLKSSPIVDVKAFEQEGRCILIQLTMENGVTLHLAASGYGAVVYKATRGNDACSRTNERSNK